MIQKIFINGSYDKIIKLINDCDNIKDEQNNNVNHVIISK